MFILWHLKIWHLKKVMAFEKSRSKERGLKPKLSDDPTAAARGPNCIPAHTTRGKGKYSKG
jgi:hypothetical protein